MFHNITSIPFVKENQLNAFEKNTQILLKNKKFFDIINGFLNYSGIKKYYKCNSYLENYNRQIEKKLSEFLYGNSKIRIIWKLFIQFIKNKEEE